MYILKVQNLVKTYGGRTVVKNVSFDVQEGEIVGLLGRNGAGKTTSFRMSIGMVRPDEGSVIFNGQDVSSLPMYQRAKRGMGYLSQEPSIFQRLSVEDNLLAILETRPHLRKAERLARAEELMAQFDLTKNRKQHARTLSGGERRKLEIARALITEPTLILLDEPFSGVDPVAVQELQDEIRTLRQDGIAMLVTDHNVHHILEVCDRVYLISEGQVVFTGTPREMIKDEQVRKLYLGTTFKGDEFDEPLQSKTHNTEQVIPQNNPNEHLPDDGMYYVQPKKVPEPKKVPDTFS